MATKEEMNQKLYNAAKCGDVNLVQDCLREGADLLYKDGDGWTPLHQAAGKGNTDVIKVLLEAGASPSAVDYRGSTPLHLAAEEGNTDVTKVLLEAGASLSAVDIRGWTPLHRAAWNGNTDVIKVLLEAGASLSAVDSLGMTPLHLAAERGNTDVIKVLLEARASLSAVDYRGWTPLHLAAEEGNIDVTKVLLEAGASLSAVDKQGMTPLHWAAREGNTDVIKVLLEAGASLSTVDKQGKTPHDLADGDVKKLLQKYMDKVYTMDMPSNTDEIVTQFPMMGTSDEIKELLSKGTFISYENCVYLGGACNVGKSTLASILIGEDIPQHWKSTDGLAIYFGRNGIDLKNKVMVPLKQGADDDVLSKVLRGQPDMTQEKPDTTLSKNREDVQPQDSDKGNIIPETHTIPQHKDNTLSTSTAPIPTLVPGTGKDDVHITDPFRHQSQILKVSKQNYTTIKEDIKQEIRKGKYKIEIAPSDLVDFGGQRSFDMTHQLFMRHKGAFVLMFNGRIDFSVPLDEYKQGETTESILKHWVNSILSYCTDDEDILPMIMFSATHSDEFNQEDRINRKAKLIHDLGEIFKNHKRQHRIIYDDIFFLNGKDKNDSEINRLKSKLVEVALKQKSWGKQMPMAWVPLDLQMSQMRLHNMNIISKEKLTTLNQGNEDLALTVEQIKYFLNVQHSLGKILYFDQHGLDNFIVVQPQSLVNILRSFITAECFWPKDEELRGILCTLTKTGKIAKQDLLKLWLQEKFHQHMPNDDFKEFIIQVLVHLDILVEPKHYRQEQESKVQSYLVPCIVKRTLPITDFYVKSADKMICLSYTLLKSPIPAALSFKLIGAAMNVWPLKETKEGICLYHQAAILCIDGSNELHLLVNDDKVFVYLINKVAKRFIPPNIASTVQECLTLTMTKVLEFYHKSFGNSLSTSEVSKTFVIEVGDWCTPYISCYISVPEVKEKTEWICKNNKKHDTKYPLYWIFDKNQVECDENCSGLDANDLALHPEDKHLFRLAKLIYLDECTSLFRKLGLSPTTWNDIQNIYSYDSTVSKFVALCEWKKQKYQKMSEPTFQELSTALSEDYHTHFLCQVLMEDVKVYGISNSALQEIPEDNVLQDLSKEVGNCAIHLGVELGLKWENIEETLTKYPKSMFEQTFDIMKKWKISAEVKTIRMLMKAFQSVDGRGLKFLRKKYGMAEATKSRHESNYIKIAMVVLRVSPRAVRVKFDKEFHPDCLQRTLNRNVFLLTDLKTKKRITQPQLNLLFPRTGEPSSNDFDITLMICLLRNLMPIDIMDNRLPSATDTSLRADLSRIKFYRNFIVHCDSALVADTDFESYWNDITPAILRLGGNFLKVECDDWYGRNLDAEQRDGGLKCIKDEKRLALVEEELIEMNKKQIELEQEQSNPKNIRDWFYKLDLKCDNIDIHCIVDRRLERKYVSLSSVYNHKQYIYGQHLVDDDPLTMAVNQLNQSEFEQLYTIKSTVSDKPQLNLRHALVDASRQQLSILCRWLMANIHNRDDTNKEMESALDIAFKNLDKDTAKAISWCITKTFYNKFQVNLSHCFDVYPGLRCQCLKKGQNTNTLCSNDKLIIITAGTEVKGLPAEYKGFKIKIMDVHDKSTEKLEGETLSALLSQNYTDSYHIKVDISNSTAKKLFDSHSNLTLICPSVQRSISFPQKHEVKNELCIQLYCKLKGILPLGEIHFPDSIHGIPTDVINGEACFISKLRIGDTIGQLTSTGTLGGFAKYLGRDCFLTCAHVMYDVKTLLELSSKFTELTEVKAYNHTSHGVTECGSVIWRTFNHDDISKTSVDAALVELQNGWTMDPNDYIMDHAGNSYPLSRLNLPSPYLNLSYLDHEVFCAPEETAKAVRVGSVTKLEGHVKFPKQKEVEIVFSGSANGNECQPLLQHTPAHMQLTEGYLTDKRVFCMYNQIAVNLGLNPGDSGTCIYIVEETKRKNGCIGMAIAFCPGLTIVTPLKDILKRMST